MRKIITIAVICLMLCGCSNGHDANITNDSDIIWSSDNQTYTSKDLNELLKYQDYSIVLLNNILTKIGELEGIDVDTYLKETEDTANMYVEQGLADQLIAYYGSVNNYKSLLIIDSIVTDLYDKVANEKYDEYKEKLKNFDFSKIIEKRNIILKKELLSCLLLIWVYLQPMVKLSIPCMINTVRLINSYSLLKRQLIRQVLQALT